MKNIYEILKEKGTILSQPPVRGGVYILVQEFGNKFPYCSGYGLDPGNGNTVVDKLEEDLTVKESQRAAYNCMLSLLVNLNDKAEGLNRIRWLVKILTSANSANDFGIQSQVVNGRSSPIVKLFGEEVGLPACSIIGTDVLPGGIACEIKALVELKQKYRQQRKS